MSVIEFSASVLVISYGAGLLGSLTGLGGGVVLVPVLALLFNVDLHYAMGASLISVIATSSGAAAAFVREGYTNLRIGMFLEIAAVLGAIVGASLATALDEHVVAVVFGAVLLFSSYLSWRRREETEAVGPSHPWAVQLRMEGSYPTPAGRQAYRVQRVPLGLGIMGLAGALSGLLGIGSGAVKVIAMDQAMQLPYKVSTATSNLVIGITAAASAGIYFTRGFIDPGLTMPVVLGALAGSFTGARIMVGAKSRLLRLVFSVVLLALALEMTYQGATGTL